MIPFDKTPLELTAMTLRGVGSYRVPEQHGLTTT